MDLKVIYRDLKESKLAITLSIIFNEIIIIFLCLCRMTAMFLCVVQSDHDVDDFPFF